MDAGSRLNINNKSIKTFKRILTDIYTDKNGIQLIKYKDELQHPIYKKSNDYTHTTEMLRKVVENYYNTPFTYDELSDYQFTATTIICVKNKTLMKIISDYNYICNNYFEYITDKYNKYNENSNCFLDNRHDQSVLSLIAKHYHINEINNITTNKRDIAMPIFEAHKIYSDLKIQIYVCAHKEFDVSVVPLNNHTIIYTKNCNNELNELEYAYAEGYIMKELYNKKDQLPDYVGIAQYRRYYDSNVNYLYNVLNNGINNKKIDIICCPKKFNTTIYAQYKMYANIKDLNLIIQIISRKYPDYVQAIKESMSSKVFFMCNMCIMSRENYIKYCEWAFDILNEYDNIMNFKTYDDIYKYVDENKNLYPNTKLPKASELCKYVSTIKYSTRIQGQLLERMLNIYIWHNFKNSIFTVPMKEIGTQY
jgi:hypothetical protein